MAEDDIYKSEGKYHQFVEKLDFLTEKPQKGKYYCKNPKNVAYFRKLIPRFEAHDNSYIRRIRLFQVLKIITYVSEKDLAKCDCDDIDQIMAFSHTTNKSIKSKRDMIRDIKLIWRVLFPEKDKKGRVDETITPYPVRHLKPHIDRSKEKLRNDRINWEEFQKIVNFFSGDARLQAYIMLAVESLGRPQEILYTRIKDYEFYDNFAKIWISEHGKEGTGFLQCIDAYPYIMEWYQQHPFKDDPQAFFFAIQGVRGRRIAILWCFKTRGPRLLCLLER
ncbi:phage integrase family protein [Candidatus Woesearchaeota archaeon]|nr:phage integrase family protein [Candidatus Woesearchaeota archaeon]